MSKRLLATKIMQGGRYMGLKIAIAQSALSFMAAVGYLVEHDVKHSFYWFLAGAITLVVTWME